MKIIIINIKHIRRVIRKEQSYTLWDPVLFFIFII